MVALDLEARRIATEATLRIFRDRARDFASGASCLHLARAQIVNMGHAAPPIPAFTTPAGARRAMARAGFADVAAVLDSIATLARIAPAARWIGDLAVMAGSDGLDAIVIATGVGGMVMGWHADAPDRLHAIEPLEFIGGWRL